MTNTPNQILSFNFSLSDALANHGLDATTIGAIAGAMTGVFVLIIAMTIFFFCFRKKTEKRLTVFTSEEDDFKTSGDIIPTCAEDADNAYEYPSSEVSLGR